MDRAAPKNLNYQDVLPVAISSKAQTRSFFPEGGAIYGPIGGAHPNVVRIPVSADAFIDGPNSYIRCDLKNTQGTHELGLDFPQSFIRRVRILSGDGVVIEDIDGYNRLYAGILYPTQASMGMYSEGGITNGQNDQFKSTVAGTGTPLTSVSVATNATPLHNVQTQLVNGATSHLCFNLAAGFLNMDKYIPALMMSSGFIIEISLDVAGSVGIAKTAGPVWQISNWRYEAHLVNLDRDFSDRLRMVMEASGGVLQLASSTYRHFSGQWTGGTAAASVNCPVRAKSIKSILFKNTVESEVTGFVKYGISNGVSHGIDSFQFRVGSVNYPSQPVDCGTAAANKAVPYMELRKAFGTLNDYLHGSPIIQKGTYLAQPAAGAGSLQDAVVGALGYSFDAFPSTALESGVNSAANSLVTTLELRGNASAGSATTTVDVFALVDMMVYINLDGSTSVSI